MRKSFALLFALLLVTFCLPGCNDLVDSTGVSGTGDIRENYDKSEELTDPFIETLSDAFLSGSTDAEEQEVVLEDDVRLSEDAEQMLSDRSVSGFDADTNQTLVFRGMQFSFPKYYDVLSEDSTEEHFYYYPHELNYYSSIVFWAQDLDCTQKEYSETRSVYAESLIEKAGADATVLKSEEKTIAGLPGWIISYYVKDEENPSIQSYAFAYSESLKTIYYINQAYDGKDESNYNYLGDYERVLEEAVLLAEETQPTVEPTLTLAPAPSSAQPSESTVSQEETTRNSFDNSAVGAEQGESTRELVWVPTNGGTKYHRRSSCSNMRNPDQVSVQTAISQGFTPCKRCY